ncbi:transporter [Candidatus Acidianus copahuensis]|uniref:Transporter n=1 Tax=Candidatus Acidianus copahuensis TaxID=1160895 RepID=A0A031LQM4_9CREN|nr:YeeE/YedE thiosulfate transporter family protein [Candidatus Acidianus copahuensis]EZQ07060.1 transporter [Candidatus Acidianus copahuensis]
MITYTAPMWVGILIGFIIGAAAEIWGIANPETLIRLAKWEDRLFVICIALGLAISAPVLYGLYALGIGFHFSPKPLYVIGVGIGGLIFGSGLAISGYFPGSIWMALGEGRRDAIYAVFGAILGAATWTVLYQTPVGQWLVNTLNFGSVVIGGTHVDKFIIRPWYGTPAVIFGISLVYAVGLFLVAYYLPRYKGGVRSCLRENIEKRSTPYEVEKHKETAMFLTDGGLPYSENSIAKKLNEYYATESNVTRWFMVSVAGIVGLTVVLEMFLHQIFGESTTDSWLAGMLFLPTFKYSQSVFAGIGWEPFSDIGTLMGALFASVFLTRRFTSFRNIIPPSWSIRFGNSQITRFLGSFGGAYLMLFGARMADGCASGHILSGDLQMAISGLEFTAAVFAAMLITAHYVYRKR